MKRRELNALSRSTCELLLSRNNDINGYWGIGVICRLLIGSARRETAFRIEKPGMVRVFGCELTHSDVWTETLFTLGVESMDGRLGFLRDGQYNGRDDRYMASLAVCLRQENRVGMAVAHAHCWAHDPGRESRRAYVSPPKIDFSPATKPKTGKTS